MPKKESLILRKENVARLKTYGERAFAVAAPKLGNSIPLELRSSSLIDIFKRHLKTYLFKQAF